MKKEEKNIFFTDWWHNNVLSSAGINVLLCTLCLTDELSTPNNLHLTTARTQQARLESIIGRDIEVNNTGLSFVSKLISCTTTRNKNHAPNLKSNEAHWSGAPKQHVKDCLAVFSYYRASKYCLTITCWLNTIY